MKYKEATRYIMSHLPMFQNKGATAYRGGLENTVEILNLLGHPEKKTKFIHIAGTNGKGSVSSILASIFTASGYKTGLYTSPHLKDFRERIRIDGKKISTGFVSRFTEKHIDLFNRLQPSFFEMSTCMAFEYFAQENVDIAIIETGLGGRLDSTNVMRPELSIITNIALDHTAILGESIEEIAYEKAGIIKPSVPVIIGEKQIKSAVVFEKIAQAVGSEIIFAEEFLNINIEKHILVPPLLLFRAKASNMEFSAYSELAGPYQINNLRTALAAILLLKKTGFGITINDIKSALKNINSLSGLTGRWHFKAGKINELYDTGHNEHGLKFVCEVLRSIDPRKLHCVIGMVSDKKHENVLKLFPENAKYYFAKPAIERGLDANTLKKIAKEKANIEGTTYQTVKKALAAARKTAKPGDLIFIGGSTFVVGEVI